MDNVHTFDFSEAKLALADRTGVSRELLCLLANLTGTLWRLSATDIAIEIMSPYRRARFWVDVEGEWQPYQGVLSSSGRVRVEIGPLEKSSPDTTLTPAQYGGDEPQEGIAKLAYRFFETRATDSNSCSCLTTST